MTGVLTTHVTDRLESSLTGLSSATGAVARDAVVRSIDAPVTLVGATGRASSERRDGDLRTVATAVAALAGYVRLREDLLEGRYETARERDLALLASDHLHATAHETISDADLPVDRQLACYRLLTNGSQSLASTLFTAAETRPDETTIDRRRRPRAVLAATGSALGAAAAGGTDEVVSAASTYGESVAAAADLACRSTDSSEAFETLRRALDGDRLAREDAPVAADTTETEIDRHLERARDVVSVLPASPARTRLERAIRTLTPERRE